MDLILLKIDILLIVMLCLAQLCSTQDEERLVATSPVNPVEEGGIFALHCQVRNIVPGDEVSIYRKQTGDVKTRISIDSTLKSETDERIYLAVRQLTDGNSVYFLTIMDVQKEDEGEYTCEISNTENNENEPTSTVKFLTKYFPPETDPLCDPVDVSNVDIRQMIILTCSSELGNPEVDIEWTITGTEQPLESETSYINNRIVSTLTVDITDDHVGAIFMCHVKSVAFPGQSSSCHVGPVRLSLTNPTNDLNLIQDTSIILSNKPKETPTSSAGSVSNAIPQDCKRICQTNSNIATYWTIGTIAAGVLAVLLCIWVIILYIKHRQLPNQYKTGYIPARQLSEGIYSEPETFRCNNTMNTMYITLDKQKKQHAVEQDLYREIPAYNIQHLHKPDA